MLEARRRGDGWPLHQRLDACGHLARAGAAVWARVTVGGVMQWPARRAEGARRALLRVAVPGLAAVAEAPRPHLA